MHDILFMKNTLTLKEDRNSSSNFSSKGRGQKKWTPFSYFKHSLSPCLPYPLSPFSYSGLSRRAGQLREVHKNDSFVYTQKLDATHGPMAQTHRPQHFQQMLFLEFVPQKAFLLLVVAGKILISKQLLPLPTADSSYLLSEETLHFLRRVT